jgi:putative membrane protein
VQLSPEPGVGVRDGERKVPERRRMIMNVRTPLLAAAALALGLGLQVGCDRHGDQNAGMSQTRAREDQNPPPSGNRDAGFLATAAQANLAEVDAGRLALKKSTNSDLKKFAQHMIEDHTQANSDLSDLAHKKGMELPSRTDEAHQKDIARLAEMNGADFDRAYMTLMVNDHVRAVSLFERSAAEASDPEIRAFAKKMLPTLQDHLKMARDLAGKVGGPSSP